MSTVIGNLRVVLGLDSAAFQAGLQSAQEGLRRAGRGMQQIGRDLSVSVTAPIGVMGAVTLKAAGNFEAAMNRVKAATGATGKEFEALEAKAREMGRTTQFDAIQSAEAIEILAKNGLDASQIMGGALQASLLLAASSGTDLANAGDIATDVMLQFGKRAEDLTGLVDGMTGVLLVSKFGIDDYRLALAQAGGVAGGLGVDFEDFNAAIAGSSSLFASGSDAGTSFKTFLQRLVPASAPAAAAMKDLNLEFFDADGNMKSMAEVAQELQDGLRGLSDEARNDALSTIFGTDALRTAIGLAEQGADGINKLKASIADASAEEQAEARLAGYNGAMRRLAATLTELRIAIGKSGLIEFVTDLVTRLTSLILKLSETNPELLKWGTVIAGTAAAVGPAVFGLGLLVSGLGKAAVALRVVSAAFLTNPIALASAAIAAAAYLIWDNWEQVGPWFEQLFARLQQIVTGFLEIVRGIFTGDFGAIVDGFKVLWDGLTGYWQTLWNGIVGILTFAWENGIKPVTDALGVTDEIVSAWNAVKAMFDTVMNGIASAFTAAWETVKPIVDKLSNAYKAADGFYRRAAGGGAPSGGTTAPAGVDVIAPPIPVGGDVAAGYVQGVNAGQDAAYQAGAALGAATEQGLRDHTETQSPSRLFARLGTYLTDGLSGGIEAGQGDVVRSIKGVADGVIGVLEDAAFRGGSIIDGIRQMAGSMLGNAAGGLFQKGVGGLFGMMGIPGFATGVSHFRGGMATLHERGGELAIMPSGSTVIPHDLSKRMLDGAVAGGAAALSVTVTMDESTGALGAFVRNEAGDVLASGAPRIVGQSVSATKRSIGKSKRGWGI